MSDKRTIRTVFQPEVDLEVEETEFLSLRAQGLIVSGWDGDTPTPTPAVLAQRTTQEK